MTARSRSFGETLRALFSWKMLSMLALGFSSGVPFLITKDILKARLVDANIDIATIGLFSAVSLPSAYKFLWSPLMDRYSMPFLGRRRGWILFTQVALLLSIGFLGQLDPAQSLAWVSAVAVAVAFFGASQDIVLDAFRREFLKDEELGLGTGIWINAYRLANLVTVGAAFALADRFTYATVHWVLAAMMIVGILAVLFSPEPEVTTAPPRTLREAVVGPFREFFSRRGALLILSFILLYKIGDNLASAMNVPFILKMGYTKEQYFYIVKGLGMGALFGGMFMGGVLMFRLGVNRALWIFGALQMVSTLGFALLATVSQSVFILSGVVAFELLTTGLGTTAYSAFMALQTNKKFTATQFALMTSLMAVPISLGAMTTGYLAQWLGWFGFYVFCALSAIPGLLLLLKVAPWNVRAESAPARN